MTTQKLIFLKGLPASGKTTWAKDYCRKGANRAKRLNKDDLRSLLDDSVFNKDNEDVVNELQKSMAINLLKKGYSVVLDNTHLNPIHEEDYKAMVEDYNLINPTVSFEVKEFRVPIETCIERDSKRPNPVGEKVIRKMASSSPSILPILEKVHQNPNNFPAFIFDIDGTLAYMNGRSPYDYSKVHTDGCYEDVKELLSFLGSDNSIIICSGREDGCREATEKWLEDNHIYYSHLYMRKEGDTREDSIVKKEMAEEIVKKYYVKGVFDDRDRVVKMWRDIGFRCYQVNYGPF